MAAHTRHLCIATLGLAAALLFAPSAVASSRATAPATAPAAIAPLTSVTLSACIQGASAAQRSASFTTQINAVPGTSTMSVNFELEERASTSGPYAVVKAPGFGVWQTSNVGIDVFTANEQVVDLPAPVVLRALVEYRWVDRRHHVIRRAQRVTPACVIPSPEPDLFISSLRRTAGASAGTELYSVDVVNSGTAAGPFGVALSVGSTVLPLQTVSGLAAAASEVVQFSGPPCTAGTTLTAQVDPAGAIVEPVNPRRTLTLVCGSARAGD